MANSIAKLEIQNLTRVEKDAYYLRTSAGNMRIHGERIVANIVLEGRKAFKESIQRNVYAVPATTYDRTGDLGRGVKSRGYNKGIGGGEIYIDPKIVGTNGYFYPISVEHGLRTRPGYWGRHYWAKGKVAAIRNFEKSMEPHMAEIAAKLLGL